MKQNLRLIFTALSIGALSFTLPAFGEEQKQPTVTVDPGPVTPKPGMVTTFAPVVEKVAPSVVTISTSKMVTGRQRMNPLYNDPMFRRFFRSADPDERIRPPRRRGPNREPRREGLGLGSGVIVSPEGHILTNNHVIEDADDITVKLGNSSHEYKATKIGTDPDADLAVLKIEGKDLPGLTFADSDKVRVGDVVCRGESIWLRNRSPWGSSARWVAA
jgi:serine protease Do